ncbi:hypothetical protein [Elizabethkingia meningoseptica]|uniref:hypothetical protein n=1 Tax=Elizabethkingia meningoseptica TaxID=238 RepID=UPI000B34FA6C|nr:hypothetical protein [Elizabethkingia meningoseptica]
MKPTEKAKNLVDHFLPRVYCYMGSGMLTNTYDDEVANDNAIKCALICVGELISDLEKSLDIVCQFNTNEDTRINWPSSIIFWKEVRNELEKMDRSIPIVEIKKKETGIDLILKERTRQINVLGRTLENDIKINDDNQLSRAAYGLLAKEFDDFCQGFDELTPYKWDEKSYKKLYDKQFKERLVIAGALIAAELDRLNFQKNENISL